MSSTQRAEIEEEIHHISSLINAAGWGYFKEQLEQQAKGLTSQLYPCVTVEDFTMLGIYTNAGQIMTSFPEQLVARRENLVALLEDMTGEDDE